MIFRVGATLLLTVVTSCAERSAFKNASAPTLAGAAPVSWSPALGLTSIAAIPSRLAEPFPQPFDVVQTERGGKTQQGTITNCIGYHELRPKGYEPLSQPDLAAMRIEGANCHALRALQAARPASVRPLRTLTLTVRSLGELPPALGPSTNPTDRDRRAQATSAGKSWAVTDVEATLSASDAWTAQVKGKDWKTELKIIGRGDFDGDGSDDILLQTVSTGSEGSWSEVRLRLLTSGLGASVLRIARDYPL